MKKFIISIVLGFALNISSNAQNCYTCPGCNQAAYAECYDSYSFGMENTVFELACDMALAIIEATDCLQDIGYDPAAYGDVPEIIIGTACEPPFNENIDNAYNSFLDNVETLTSGFHNCAGSNGCGNEW